MENTYEDEPMPWLTCNCPNGSRHGGRPTCYHTAAVLMLIEAQRSV